MGDADQHALALLAHLEDAVVGIARDEVAELRPVEAVAEALLGLERPVHLPERVEGREALVEVGEEAGGEVRVALGLAQGLAPALVHRLQDRLGAARQVELQGEVLGRSRRHEAVAQEGEDDRVGLEMLEAHRQEVEAPEGEVLEEQGDHRLGVLLALLGEERAALEQDEAHEAAALHLVLDQRHRRFAGVAHDQAGHVPADLRLVGAPHPRGEDVAAGQRPDGLVPDGGIQAGTDAQCRAHRSFLSRILDASLAGRAFLRRNACHPSCAPEISRPDCEDP